MSSGASNVNRFLDGVDDDSVDDDEEFDERIDVDDDVQYIKLKRAVTQADPENQGSDFFVGS